MYESILETIILYPNKTARLKAGTVNIHTDTPKFLVEIEAPPQVKNLIECQSVLIGTGEGYANKSYILFNKSGLSARINLIEIMDMM